MTEFGYAGKILRVDLSEHKISFLDTTNYTNLFLGGRGIAAKIYWDETNPDTKVLDPDNCLIYMTGPLAGFTHFAGNRWQICGKSFLNHPESFSYCGLGGSWGAWLKFAGYDGLVVKGQSDKPVYIYIEGRSIVRIQDATHLWGKTTFETEDILKAEYGADARVLEIGPAAENLVTFATILASENSSGSGGLGATMGAKKLKAIVVRVDKKIRPVPADSVTLKSLAKRVSELKIKNWEEYAHDEAFDIGRPAPCFGCIGGCTRKKYTVEDNRKYKVLCQAAVVYIEQVNKYYAKGSDVYLLATRLCDSYGLDTMVMQPLIRWLSLCFDKGILSDKETGLPLSKIGSVEFIEMLVKQIALREGFGEILARGLVKGAEYVGRGSMILLNSQTASSTGELQDYDPRVMLVNALHIATEPRRPIGLLHGTSYPYIKWLNWNDGYADAGLTTDILREIAVTYWGSIEALDFSTYEGKALAAKKFQNYYYTKECMILCDMIWPIYLIHLRDSTLKPGTLESQILTAITGRKIDEAEFFEIGERIFNLQRAILINQGWKGREDDILMPYLFDEPVQTVFFSANCMVPGNNGQMISRKATVVDKNEFEKMKSEFYSLRGWDDASGLQLKSRMNKLGLDDIAENLEKGSLVK